MPFTPWKTRPIRVRATVRLVAAVWLCSGILAPGGLVLAAEGDPEAGAVVARTWCANCHVIAPDQKIARSEAPSFRALADDPGRTKEGLGAFLFAPHPPMPDLELSRHQIDDVIAYIESLETR